MPAITKAGRLRSRHRAMWPAYFKLLETRIPLFYECPPMIPLFIPGAGVARSRISRV
jgi:hypothetical protein